MQLSEYVEQVGLEDFAKRFGITERAALAYKQGTRRPRVKLAQQIVDSTPVTWEGIYSPKLAASSRASAA